MNIVVMTRSLPVHCLGGMELVSWDLVCGLAARNHNVWIITTALPTGKSFHVPPQLAGKITIEFLDGTRPGRYSGEWWKASRNVFSEKRSRFDPDIVLSISVGAMSVMPVLEDIPAIIQSHGTFLGEFYSKITTKKLYSILSSCYNLLWIPWERKMYGNATRIVAVGPAVLNALHFPILKVPLKNVVLIPNGVNTDIFCPDSKNKTKMREKLGIPTDAMVVVWASRLHKQKGAHLALQAFAKCNLRDLWFLIVGDGPERVALERQSHVLGISDRIIFAGSVDHSDIPELLNAGDVFVFTSIRREGFPLNVLEAMSMDLPVVISQNLAGPLEEANGVYPVNPLDIEGVAGALGNAVTSGKGDRSFITKNYSKGKMIDSYEQLLEEVIRENA